MNKINFIAIIGPDGAGKTTVANNIENIYAGKVVHKAANFEILPTFTEIKNFLIFSKQNKRNEEGYKGFHSGMQQNPNHLIKSFVLILWYMIDLNLGRINLARAKKNDELYVFARYFYDYYFQIANKSVPHIFLDLFLKLVPKPDLVFYIKRDARDIYEGKPELSLDEIIRQQDVIEILAKRNDNFCIVDGSHGITHMMGIIEQKMRDA